MDNVTTQTRDVIDLSASPVGKDESAPAPEADQSLEESIPQAEIERITTDTVAALKTVYDPEIPVDIYELGLIYKVDLETDRTMKIEMTLTAPGCPVAGEMPGWVQDAAHTVKGVDKVEVTLTFDPPWSPEQMSDEARLQLNML